MTSPDLFPRPRHVDWGDGWAAPDTPVTEHHDPALSSEGYHLAVGVDGVELAYGDDNGLRYARQTLGQLTTADGIATATIDDHPDIAVRGQMLDISRDRVEDARNSFKVGDSVEAKIISVDRKNRGVTLSVKAKDYDDEQEAVKSLKETEQEAASPGTIGDLIKAQMEQK